MIATEGKGKGLDIWLYSATIHCTCQFRDQQHFTTSEVAADRQALIVLRRILFASIARTYEQEQWDSQCSWQAYHRPISHRGARSVLKCGRTTGGERSEFEGDDT